MLFLFCVMLLLLCGFMCIFFFVEQKTAYEMRISDWSSDVCSSDLLIAAFVGFREEVIARRTRFLLGKARDRAHVLVGLAIAVANIDEVIRTIRAEIGRASWRERVCQYV